MYLPKYPLDAAQDFSMFRFVSNGKADHIYKLIRFSPTSHDDIVNLSFGDNEGGNDALNDRATSGNGDMPLVLATVAASIYVFTRENPHLWVFLTGSTPARTRLYRMAISNYWSDIEKDFEVRALKPEGWEPFEKGKNYEGFAVKKKPGRNFENVLVREKWVENEWDRKRGIDEAG
jgi:hypothetical protein